MKIQSWNWTQVLSIDIDLDPGQSKNIFLVVKLWHGVSSARYVCLFDHMSINEISLNGTQSCMLR